MIFCFPDLDTLRLAITSGVAPPAVSLAEAVAGFDAQGHIWLQPSVTPTAKVRTALAKLGVQVVKADGDLLAEKVCCWLQLLPLQRESAAPFLSKQAAVLFELPDPAQLGEVVGEVLRLGNDRQSFRYLKDETGTCVLLRVIGPPYYSLLRALDREGQAAAPRAYVERAPRVWVEIGHTHPLVEQVRPPEGTLLLMRPPREWTFIADGPFRDIYDILEFALPGERRAWTDTAPAGRLRVPLRLVPGSHRDAPELWVVRDRADEQIDALVREARDEELQRLAFAVGLRAGQRIVVLRVRPSKHAPPVLQLDAERYRPYQKMPNLFLPCGWSLQPSLRRDVLRNLLASDPARITWLAPTGEGGFIPEELPDEAFRPLHDWVDYVLDQDRQALQEWVQAAQFDFEPFVCKDDQSAKPKGPPPEKEPRKPRDLGPDLDFPEEEGLPVPEIKVVKHVKKPVEAAEDDFIALPRAKPSELQLRLRELEQKFVSLEGPLHADERQALWPEMALLNTALNCSADAAVCWSNALWETDSPPPEWAARWACADAQLSTRQLTGADLDRLLAIEPPTQADLRALVACVVWGAQQKPPAPALLQRLPRVRQYLEQHEELLWVRGAWLAWTSLVRLSSGDVLGLARVRDRLLERLLNQGLRPEHDLPTFLRFSGQQSSERFRAVRDRVQGIRELTHLWISSCYSKKEDDQKALSYTLAYADLMFAFGLARLGEASACRTLKEQAQEVLAQVDDAHQFLAEAYGYRIQQVLEGQPHGGLLPAAQLEYLESMERMQRYKVDRLRFHSRILEPQEKFDPYRHMRKHADELNAELVTLPDLTDRDQLSERVGQLLQDKRKTFQTVGARVRILSVALQVAPRLGEAIAVEWLELALATLDQLTPPLGLPLGEQVAGLVDHALFVAAHFDRHDHVQKLVPWFLELLEEERDRGSANIIDLVAGQCLRGLRKLGLRDEIERLLVQMSELILRGKSLAALRGASNKNWPNDVRLLLHIAGGWLYFGREQQAQPVLDEARELLFHQALAHYERTPLACNYIATLGQASVDEALKRIEELFAKLAPIVDVYTTNKDYGRPQLEIIEAVVLAVLSDDFAIGSTARRWLDEDEYLVRRRIHRDVRALMAQTGL
jgi:hypothetical protein